MFYPGSRIRIPNIFVPDPDPGSRIRGVKKHRILLYIKIGMKNKTKRSKFY
jgi:hypothetical protein